MHLILASTSRYRKELLDRLKIPFSTARPHVDETALPGESPRETAIRLARLKATNLAAAHPNALIIGSDQVATFNGTVLGKPGSHKNAVDQLNLVSGRTVEFHTAVSLHNTQTGKTETRIETCEVTFRSLSAETIERYLLLSLIHI